MRISDWSSDVCSSDLGVWAAASALTTAGGPVLGGWLTETFGWPSVFWINPPLALVSVGILLAFAPEDRREQRRFDVIGAAILASALGALAWALSQIGPGAAQAAADAPRSEEHTSELQSLMRISSAVFCVKKKKIKQQD